MNREEDLLQQIMRIACVGRDFFTDVQPRIADPEIRAAFEYIGDTKGRFIVELAPWVRSGEAQSDHVSAAMSAEKIYVDLKRRFNAAVPQASAALLAIGEGQLVRLVERAYESAGSSVLQKLLKVHYPALVICREAMSRLSLRRAA